MSERYKKYARNKFRIWCSKVALHLPKIASDFYSYPYCISYEKHVLLGRVIANINNPFYSIQDHDGKRLDSNNEMTMEVLLELQVNELFSFVNKLKNTTNEVH